MSDCAQWLTELTHTSEQVLAADLAALARQPERERIERYNTLKSDEETFTWEYGKECPTMLTGAEQDRIRGELKLARLLVAASFYTEEGVPRAMEGDFIEAELQAVVEFDRYKQFDALDRDQLEARIRRMDGEVYELAKEYSATQIADMTSLIENPDVQQDLMERLLERYDQRRERIRAGLSVYVETHGIAGMVEGIEQAIGTVASSADTREAIHEEVTAERERVAELLEGGPEADRQARAAELDRIERALARPDADLAALERSLGAIERPDGQARRELETAIDRAGELAARLADQHDRLATAHEGAQGSDAENGEAMAGIVEAERGRVTRSRRELDRAIERLEGERERLASADERLADHHDRLEEQVAARLAGGDPVAPTVPAGIDGAAVVTAATARLFELDYLGRFDTTMHETTALALPDRTVELPTGYWEGRSERRTQASELSGLLGESDASHESYPHNPTARYELTERRYLGLRSETELIVEAAVHSDLRAHATAGYDSSPAGIDALLGLLNPAIEEADRRETAYLLGVASPTGWSDRVHDRIEREGMVRTHASRRLHLVLVDLRDGTLLYDGTDDVVRQNLALFERAVDADRVAGCVERLRADYVSDLTRETVGLDEVHERYDLDQHIIRQAFAELADAGEAEQFYVPDDGLAIEMG